MAKRKIFYADQTHDYAYYGTSGSDRMYTASHDDVLYAKAGDDTLLDEWGGSAAGSSDTFYAGKGDDKVYSLSGDDFIFGGAGDDMISVNDFGNEDAKVFVNGGKGDDVLWLNFDNTGEWVRVEDSTTEETISVDGRDVTYVNVEMIYV